MSTELSIRIDRDGLRATVCVPAGFDPGLLTKDAVLAVATASEVAINAGIAGLVEQTIATNPDLTKGFEFVIAEAVPPKNGTDGSMEWEEGKDPKASSSKPEDTGQRADYYHGRDYIRVQPGDVIGYLHPPTVGEDGHDVRGRTIQARPGKPCPYKPGQGVTLRSDGSLVADVEGVLLTLNDSIEVSQQLDIRESVDFSTGNIDFSGAVSVGDAIRSGFCVKADGSVIVGGLIEDARIECGGDLVARRGMAGKSRGYLKIGGNLGATYLEEVLGEVGGDVEVRRGIIGCEMTVNGDLDCSGGVVRGGSLHVKGRVRVKTLGSEVGTPTVLQVSAGRPAGPSEAELAALKETLDALTEEESQLKQLASHTNAQRERMTEIAFEIDEARSELEAAQRLCEQAQACPGEGNGPDVEVASRLHSGVTLLIGNERAVFRDNVNGPLHIGKDESGHLVCRFGSGKTSPLETIAHINRIKPAQAA